MAKTYTVHKLTDHQLHSLSAICHGRKSRGGAQRDALERKGLVLYFGRSTQNGFGYVLSYKATTAGVCALAQARKEGW